MQAKSDQAAIDRLQRAAREPLRLPSLGEITRSVFDLDRLLAGDVDQARLRLRRWLKDGEIKVSRHSSGGCEVRGSVDTLAIVAEGANPRRNSGIPTGESILRSGGSIDTSISLVCKDFSGFWPHENARHR